MAPLRRLVLLGALVLTGSGSVSADGSAGSSSVATVKPQCAATSLKAADAPVRAPLAAVVGAKLVDTVFTFLTDTPLGKLVASDEAHTCLANLNGTVVGTTLLDRLKTPTCAPFTNLTDVPFVKYALDALTANATATPSFNDMLKYFKAVPNAQVEQFCDVFTTGVVPCLATELLPALAVLRPKFSNGCCDEWSDQVFNDYGYTISGQVTKMAQLFGDVMCAKQTLGAASAETQRCGYTMMQTLLTKNDSASFAATVLRNLQVPSSQMCLRAEGKPYADTNNNSVATAEPAPSGCVITLDRITSWVYGLPSTERSETFDVKMLLEDDKCLPGGELFPSVKYLLPQIASGEVEVFFSKSCVHLPMQFGSKCVFSRPALLVEWENEPQPVTTKEADDAGPSSSTSATATPGPSRPAATPVATTSSASARGFGIRGVFSAVLTIVVALTVAL